MSEEITVKTDALEPLFEAWEEPNRHRVRAASGEGAVVQNQRRPSPICDGTNFFHKPLPFDMIIADKKTNSEGMQFADLTARPIGVSVLRPNQQNRAMEMLDGKFYRDGGGNKSGMGLKVFP